MAILCNSKDGIITGLTVRLMPADNGACAKYRIHEPARVTKTLNWDVKTGFNFFTDRDADVVVIQRPMHREIAEKHIPQIQAAGIAVVVEIDDDFCALPFGNLAFYFTHPKRDPNMNAHWLKRACAIADLVTCTTPALARRYAAHGRYAVLPNYIPAHYLDIPHAGNNNTIGWAGNIQYHPHDLDVCGSGIAQAIEQLPDATFLAIGDEHIAAALRIPKGRHTHQPFVPLPEYPHQLARYDVGIVPLEDTQFNNGKSALKMLEYAACGVYPIVTPSPDNMRLHEQYGIGSIARKPREWMRTIINTMHDHDARHAATTHTRTIIGQSLTYERHAADWHTAWHAARINRYATQHTTHVPA